MDAYEFSIVKTVIISAVIVLNISMNCLVIAVIARYPAMREDRTTMFVVGLSISQWLSCPLAIWNLLFGMAILLYLVKSCVFAVRVRLGARVHCPADQHRLLFECLHNPKTHCTTCARNTYVTLLVVCIQLAAQSQLGGPDQDGRHIEATPL